MTKMAVPIFDGGLPKCKEYFLHKFSKKVPAGMKAINYNHKGNEAQWDEVKPCSVGVAITWLAKFHPEVVKARESEIKYCWAKLPLFCSKDSKGHSRKHFLLDSVVIDHQSEMFHLIVHKDDPHIKTWMLSKFKNESGRILALKKLLQHPVKGEDAEVPPKYFKKKVPLWDYLEGLESKLTVAHTKFKPVLIPESLHVQRAKNCFNKFAGFNHKYDPNFNTDKSKFNLVLRHIREAWCNDQQYLFDYVTKWMAHLVQRPYKTGIALIIYSHKHGTGKNMVRVKVYLLNGLPTM